MTDVPAEFEHLSPQCKAPWPGFVQGFHVAACPCWEGNYCRNCQGAPTDDCTCYDDLAIKTALHSYQGGNKRWKADRKSGLTDAELKERLGSELGAEGGSSSPFWQYHKGGKNPQIEMAPYNAGALKYATRKGKMVNVTSRGVRIYKGRKLLEAVRRIMGIGLPGEKPPRRRLLVPKPIYPPNPLICPEHPWSRFAWYQDITEPRCMACLILRKVSRDDRPKQEMLKQLAADQKVFQDRLAEEREQAGPQKPATVGKQLTLF